MKTFISEGTEIQVPDIEAISQGPQTLPILRIKEGQHAGTCFQISNIRMDDVDESLMWYELDIVDDTGQTLDSPVDQIKETVDNFILMVLHEQIERAKNENPPTK